MEAGASRTLLRLTYEGTLRMVEPYSLHFKRRKDGVAQEYLYVYDRTGGRSGPGIKGLLNYKINNVEVTEEKFDPRYEIELAKAGEFADRTTFGGTFRVNRTALRPGAVRGRGTGLRALRRILWGQRRAGAAGVVHRVGRLFEECGQRTFCAAGQRSAGPGCPFASVIPLSRPFLPRLYGCCRGRRGAS
ncbi:hypothetical protein ACRJ4B_38200 [Streptomyces sp. GTA36]